MPGFGAIGASALGMSISDLLQWTFKARAVTWYWGGGGREGVPGMPQSSPSDFSVAAASGTLRVRGQRSGTESHPGWVFQAQQEW